MGINQTKFTALCSRITETTWRKMGCVWKNKRHFSHPLNKSNEQQFSLYNRSFRANLLLVASQGAVTLVISTPNLPPVSRPFEEEMGNKENTPWGARETFPCREGLQAGKIPVALM